MPRVSRKGFRNIIIVSAVVGSMVIIYPYIAFWYNMPILFTPDVHLVLGFIIFPVGIAHLLNVMWRRAIDRNIPKLLRQLAEAGRIGVSIPKALEIASRYDLGPLTPELKKVVAKLSWGYPLDKVLEDLIEDIGTPTARRTFKLVIEASRSGGDIEEMFMVLQRHISGMQLTLRERMAIMRPYISYGYIAFFVFIAIQIVLLKSFFIPIIEIRESLTAAAGGVTQIFRLAISVDEIKTLFYHASILEAIISGFVSGKMGEGTIFAGLKHIAILLLATILSYYLFVF